MDMLSSLEGTSQSASVSRPPAASTAKVPAHEVKLGLRASDIAFPSGNNIYDHSPSAPFDIDLKVLLDVAPAQTTNATLVTDEDEYMAAHEEYARRSLSQSKIVSVPNDSAFDPNMTCIMGFGAAPDENTPHAVAFCDPITRQFLRAHPLFARPLYIEPHYSSIPVYIASSRIHKGESGIGKGLFATRRIIRDEILFREPPLVLMSLEISFHVAMQFDELTSQTMPKRTQEALDALHNCWPGNDRYGRMRTNMIAVDLPTKLSEDGETTVDRTLGGCFQLVSRANHSCAANVSFEWDYKTLQGSLIADRVIEPGEEICICYCDPRDTKAVRREEILRKYRFKCTCPRCGP
ncbi:hypothetical protein EXIGLDRAFT_722058, partial [Exidia glandulosa HHB12029]